VKVPCAVSVCEGGGQKERVRGVESDMYEMQYAKRDIARVERDIAHVNRDIAHVKRDRTSVKRDL